MSSVVGTFSGSSQFIFLWAIFFSCSLSEYLCPRWPGFFITWKIPPTPNQKEPQVNHISIYFFPHKHTHKEALGNKAECHVGLTVFRTDWFRCSLMLEDSQTGHWVPETWFHLLWFLLAVLPNLVFLPCVWLIQASGIKCVLAAQSSPILCQPMHSSPAGSFVHRILQARRLEWIAVSFSRGSSWPSDQIQVSCIVGRFFVIWTTREAWFQVPFPAYERRVLGSCDCSHPLSSLGNWFQELPQIPKYEDTQVPYIKGWRTVEPAYPWIPYPGSIHGWLTSQIWRPWNQDINYTWKGSGIIGSLFTWQVVLDTAKAAKK